MLIRFGSHLKTGETGKHMAWFYSPANLIKPGMDCLWCVREVMPILCERLKKCHSFNVYIVKINCGKKFPNSIWQLNLEVRPFNKTSWNEYFGLCTLFVFPTGVLSIMKLWLLALLLQNNIMKGEPRALYQKISKE